MFTLELSKHDDSKSQGIRSFTGGLFRKNCAALHVESDMKKSVWAWQSVVSEAGRAGGGSVVNTKAETDFCSFPF